MPPRYHRGSYSSRDFCRRTLIVPWLIPGAPRSNQSTLSHRAITVWFLSASNSR